MNCFYKIFLWINISFIQDKFENIIKQQILKSKSPEFEEKLVDESFTLFSVERKWKRSYEVNEMKNKILKEDKMEKKKYLNPNSPIVN